MNRQAKTVKKLVLYDDISHGDFVLTPNYDGYVMITLTTSIIIFVLLFS